MSSREAALKAWETRRANKRSEAAKKAWVTRRRKAAAKKAVATRKGE